MEVRLKNQPAFQTENLRLLKINSTTTPDQAAAADPAQHATQPRSFQVRTPPHGAMACFAPSGWPRCGEMRLLDRNLLRELLVPLGYCLSGFLIFWIAFDLFNELNRFQGHKLNPADVAEYYLVKLPELLGTVLPVALLLALLHLLTTLARPHELIAIRAAGVSIWRLSVPCFVVGFGMSLDLFALTEMWSVDSQAAGERILNRHLANQPDAAGPQDQRTCIPGILRNTRTDQDRNQDCRHGRPKGGEKTAVQHCGNLGLQTIASEVETG